MKRLFTIVMTFLFVSLTILVSAKSEGFKEEPASKARLAENAKLKKFFGPKWTVETEVFCAAVDPLSCDDHLEFNIDVKDFDQKELKKVLDLWKKQGRGRTLEMLEHPSYKLDSIAALFSFPREPGMPSELFIVFYYVGKSKDALYESVQIHNGNIEWYPTIITVKQGDTQFFDTGFEYHSSLKDISKK